ncbi:MAG: hypothetical protein M3295_10255, partial [Chloroflexota bacterium]|nr:hypothetical protein [Chloroflexota bacterium]
DMAALARLVDLDASIAALETALDELGPDDAGDDASRSAAIVELSAELATARLYREDYAGALTLADRAMADAERLGLWRSLAEARITRGTALGNLGRIDDALLELDAALAFAAERGLVTSELRARLDLSAGPLLLTDAARSVTVAREGYELASRLGMRDWALNLASPALTVAVWTGAWDWAEATIAELDATDLPSTWRTDLAIVSRVIAVLRGREEAGAGAPAHRRDAPLTSSSAAYVRIHEAIVAMVTGRLDEAYTAALDAASASTATVFAYIGPAVAARSALWARDADRAEIAVRALDAIPVDGALLQAGRASLHAGLAALRGDRGAARSGYLDAANRWRTLRIDLELGLTLLDLATLVGDDDAAALTAADEARALFERLGAAALLARLPARVP